MVPDPDSDEWKETVGDLPPEYWEDLAGAVSPEHFAALARVAHQHYEAEQTLASYGGAGVAGRVAVAMLDPISLAIGIGSGGIGWLSKGARTAKALKAAFGPAKINYGAYSDKLPHFHVHLVPKYVDGPSWGTTFTMMPEPKKLLADTDYTALVAQIRAAL